MPAPSSEEDRRHARFLDLCLSYGDFNRPVFLDAIRDWFIESASANELESLRRAIRDRARALQKVGSKGRPRAEQGWHWICSTLRLVWKHDIEGSSWREIASAFGIKPTNDNIRTLQKRRDHYAMLVWKTLPGRADDPQTLARRLESRSIQRLLRSRLALPFNTHPKECKKIVLTLAPRGLEVAATDLNRVPDRRVAAGRVAASPTRK